jgi:hypothetical protein
MQAKAPEQSKEPRRRPLEPAPAALWVMVLCALAVGVIAGFGAVVFRAMIGGIHNLLFLGRFSWNYDANVHTPASPWGAWIILAPVVSAIGVAFLVKTFAPEAKGHGVPEVMDAIYHRDGRIRPIVAVIKSLASAVSIGSGGSVGREGPIIQIGAAFGSTLGQLIAMPARQRAVLIAAGGGGGIAATFNTPIGGIVFAVELMLPTTTAMSLCSVALSVVTATFIGRRGALAPQGLQVRMARRTCAEIMTADFRLLSQQEASLSEIVREAILSGQVVVVTGQDHRNAGVIDEGSGLEYATGYVLVEPEENLYAIGEADARLALVARNGAEGKQRVLGVIIEHAVAELAYAAARAR